MAWENGTPEREAALRDINGRGSIDDVLLLLGQNLRDCLDALPVDEQPPKFDAFHASCCALRAYAYSLRLQKMLPPPPAKRPAPPGPPDWPVVPGPKPVA